MSLLRAITRTIDYEPETKITTEKNAIENTYKTETTSTNRMTVLLGKFIYTTPIMLIRLTIFYGIGYGSKLLLS